MPQVLWQGIVNSTITARLVETDKAIICEVQSEETDALGQTHWFRANMQDIMELAMKKYVRAKQRPTVFLQERI